MTGRDGVFTETERERIEALWRLMALPPRRVRRDLRRSTGAGLALHNCARGGGLNGTPARGAGLCGGVAEGAPPHVLPCFGAAKDAARLTEVMSFALAAAMLAERLLLVLGRRWASGWCPAKEDVPG